MKTYWYCLFEFISEQNGTTTVKGRRYVESSTKFFPLKAATDLATASNIGALRQAGGTYSLQFTNQVEISEEDYRALSKK